ncbi:MAG: hypothetical protein ACJAU6_001926 [Alphaproteobacteria bacterium]|jgi:hypothetical protein
MMASSGGVLVVVILLFDTVIKFDANDEFWQLVFPS